MLNRGIQSVEVFHRKKEGNGLNLGIMMMRTTMLGLLMIAAASAEDWREWRGPGARGAAEGAKPPEDFGPGKNERWRVRLPGRGCSTPMVWDGLIVVTAAIDGKDGVMAFDEGGKEVWRRTLGEVRAFRHQAAGSGCNPSPLTDGERIYVHFKSGELAALDRDGGVAWQRNLHEEYVPDGLKWDLGTSPVLAGGNLVVSMFHLKGPSFLLAFNPESGKEVWKVSRDFDAPEASSDSYTTPLVCEVDGVETIVCWGADHVTGHDAKTGREIWKHGNLNPDQRGNWRAVASAVELDGIAFVPFGRGNNVAGVKLGGSGDTTGSNRLWTRNDRGSDSATPLAANGRFFLLQDNGKNRGTVSCVIPESGEVEWETRLPKGVAIYFASPLVAGDRFIAARSDGMVFHGRLSKDGLHAVKEVPLEESIVASPVAVGERLYIRTHDSLWCFGEDS